jgi:hypothetical protein
MNASTAIAFALVPAACWLLFWSGTPASRVKRFIGDVVLVTLSFGVTVLILWHGGFIGNGDIQPYPY